MTDLRLSPSQISAWCVCHYAWYLQYQERRARPPMGTIPGFGIMLHNLLEHLTRCVMNGERFQPPKVEDYLESMYQSAQAAGENMTEAETRRQIELVISHLEVFRGAYLPKLRPVAVEEGWNWNLEDSETGDAVTVYCRGDFRDERGFWLDHKLKSKVPSDRGSVPAADLLEQMILTSACPETSEAYLQVYAKTGRKQVVIPLRLTSGAGALYPDRAALVDATVRMVLGFARGIRAGDDAPTGLYTERWGRQTCYYCDWRKSGACKYQGGC